VTVPHLTPAVEAPSAHAAFAALRARGLRLSSARRLLLQALYAADQPLSAEELAGDGDLASAYRNLEVLEELGLVRHAHLSDRAPTYHSVTGHEHFHLVCRNCQKVVSVDPDVLNPLLETLDADHGFTADVGHLTVFGLCEECR
jgi:Fur family ferric uptake transcriptional regulator